MPDISHEALTRLLSYDTESGVFTRASTGLPTGCHTVLGYILINVARQQFLAHRLAWFYMHKSWPESLIDHVNQNKKDNRLCNLRIANRSQNALNSSKQRAKSGRKGVYYQSNSDKWRVKLGNQHIGYFASKEEASLAWQLAAQQRAGSFYAGDR